MYRPDDGITLTYPADQGGWEPAEQLLRVTHTSDVLISIKDSTDLSHPVNIDLPLNYLGTT